MTQGRGERSPRPCVVVVTLSGSVPEFVERLGGVEGARLVREIAPGRVVVVALASSSDKARIAGLPGVVSVHEDRLEHPTESHPAD